MPQNFMHGVYSDENILKFSLLFVEAFQSAITSDTTWPFPVITRISYFISRYLKTVIPFSKTDLNFLVIPFVPSRALQ